MERLIDKYLPADYHDTFIVKAQKPAEQIIPKELIKKYSITPRRGSIF